MKINEFHLPPGGLSSGLTGTACDLLRELFDARKYAETLGQDPWEFAVEVRSLWRRGLTNADLRWLICNGLLEHGLEHTQCSDARRTFVSAGNLILTEQSCFVLTPAGVSLLSAGLVRPNSAERSANIDASNPSGGDVPYWDDEAHSLYFRRTLVKHFRSEATNQEDVLRAFQRSGWSRSAVVTLEDEPGVSSKERLRDTVKNLNRSVLPHLHFSQEGCGARVVWEARGPTASLPQRYPCNSPPRMER